MKNRAGTVGRVGLGPVLGRLPAGVRAHLAGHSFGARLVSFALAGLPAGPSQTSAPWHVPLEQAWPTLKGASSAAPLQSSSMPSHDVSPVTLGWTVTSPSRQSVPGSMAWSET